MKDTIRYRKKRMMIFFLNGLNFFYTCVINAIALIRVCACVRLIPIIHIYMKLIHIGETIRTIMLFDRVVYSEGMSEFQKVPNDTY